MAAAFVISLASSFTGAAESLPPRSAEDTARIALLLAPPADPAKAEAYEANSAGAATVPATTDAKAFTHPSANLSDPMRFTLGQALFAKLWIAAPASTLASDGLGPLYNARACQACHIRDGRGRPLTDTSVHSPSLILRLGIPDPAGTEAYLATLPDPIYGTQLQDFAAPGQTAEGRMSVTYTALPVFLADGLRLTLRQPTYAAANLAYGPLDPATILSPRLAPQMIGLGLLEAIPAEDILAREDPDDSNGDGISGRANMAHGPDGPRLGRFGLKAASATIRDQSAQAFAIDMGLSTPLRHDPAGDCTAQQPACRSAPDGETPGLRDGREVDQATLDLVAYYSRNLGVPARRDVEDPTVLQGKAVFSQLNCTGCHTPKHVTARLPDGPEQSFQLIWPYTDLLLHDMGPGLADGLPEGLATGTEWRTPPLWGIGLAQQVSPEAGFLHDGRARTLLEAILWHSGEAEAQRDAVIAMPTPDRNALIRFLESL